MTSMLAMVEMNGCILNLAVKKPAMVVNTVHSTTQTTSASSTRTSTGRPVRSNVTPNTEPVLMPLCMTRGGGGHAHADHTADGQVRAGEQDQPGDAQRQEHARRSLLQDVEDVVDGQQLQRRP